jgi:hypothetical protein
MVPRWHQRASKTVSFGTFLFEEITPLTELAGPGLKPTIESIDNRSDFKVYMQNYAYAHGGVQRGPRRTGPEHEGFVSRALITVHPMQTNRGLATSSTPTY